MNSNAYFRHYAERASAGEPVLPHCRSCQAVYMPPRAACPECGTPAPGWTSAADATGTLYSFTVVETKEGANIIGLADLDMITEGSKFYASVLGVNATDVAVGQRVTVDTAMNSEGVLVPVLMAKGAAT